MGWGLLIGEVASHTPRWSGASNAAVRVGVWEPKLAASFWNNVGAGMVIGGMAAAFFLDKPQGTWTKIGIAIAGLVLGWLCYSIASNILTYMHTASEERH
jgi:hypothetical protein